MWLTPKANKKIYIANKNMSTVDSLKSLSRKHPKQLKRVLSTTFPSIPNIGRCTFSRHCDAYFTPPYWVHDLYKITKKLLMVFAKFNIEYAACCGSALGAIRHNGLIPWDDDNDFYVTENSYDMLRTKALVKYAEKHGLSIHINNPIFKPLKLLKVTKLGGKPDGGEPFIDLFAVRKTSSGNYLTYFPLAITALRMVNPLMGAEKLVKGIEWKETKHGDIKFITTKFKWYDLKFPLLGDGYMYVKRVFGSNCLKLAVLRTPIALIAKNHKIADLRGLWVMEGPMAAKLKSNGKIDIPGAAAERRLHGTYKKQGKSKRMIDYWGGKTSQQLHIAPKIK
jgi:hypothetical protein